MPDPDRTPYMAMPALFDRGFRPFFLLAGLWAPTALLLWLAMLAGILEPPTAMDPVAWHVHEMLFGFIAAAIAGFLLTAVPGWTARPPLRGLPLAALAALWAAGRIAVALSAWIGAAGAAAVDLAFLAGLAAYCAREIAIGRSWRNLAVIALLALLIAANALFHLGETETAQRAAIATIVTLVALIGGRVVPEFTRNWLARRGAEKLPAQRDRFDSAAMAATIPWSARRWGWPRRRSLPAWRDGAASRPRPSLSSGSCIWAISGCPPASRCWPSPCTPRRCRKASRCMP